MSGGAAGGDLGDLVAGGVVVTTEADGLELCFEPMA